VAKAFVTITTIVILITSIFTIINSYIIPRPVYGLAAGRQAQQNTVIPPELAASTINSGKDPNTDIFNITKGYIIKPVLWNLTLPSRSCNLVINIGVKRITINLTWLQNIRLNIHIIICSHLAANDCKRCITFFTIIRVLYTMNITNVHNNVRFNWWGINE
jgi:hypothetical protein